MSTVQKKQTNLREKLAELLDFRKMRDRLSGLGLYIGKDRTNTDENLLVRGGANVDDLQLGEIAALVGGTAVDVFVYDTGRDSDGGKWRERTQHTSWYNEELNTATRGSRKEFPAVAVIVAESNKVTIYDGDDPDLGMWMVFNASGSRMIWATQLSCVSSLNAKISIGSPASGFRYIDFVSENMREWRTGGVNSISGNISERNNGSLTLIDVPGQDVIVNQIINDVAMTILPNAPIDENTGLPVPTIAVATDGGVSVIKDDGTVVNGGITQKHEKIHFSKEYTLITAHADQATSDGYRVSDYPSYVNEAFTFSRQYRFSQSVPSLVSNEKPQDILGFGDYVVGGCLVGLNYFEEDKVNNTSGSNSINGVAAYITSKYNTGWMPGDIKLATLSDTTVENIGVNSDELSKLTQGSASDANATWTVVNDTNINVSDYTNVSYFTIAFAEDLIVGNIYEGELIVSNFSGPLDSIGFASQINKGIGSNIRLGSNGSIKFTFKHQGDDVKLFTAGGAGGVEISIRATTELITNGDFSTDVTASDGQTSGGWTSNKAQLSIESGRLKIIDAGSSSAAYQAINTIAQKKYILSLSGQFNDGSDGNIQVRDAGFSGTVLNSIDPIGLHETPKEFSLTFVAQSSTTIVRMSAASTSSFTATFDNISVRPAVDDRSVNNNGLQVIGEINKAPVAPGADLVAYSGFSANNYLVQPYNEDLDFGTGDFCIMGWARSSGNSQAYISIGPESATGARLISGVDSGNRWFFSVFDNTDDIETRYLSRDLSAYSDAYDWVHLVGGRRGGVFFFYLNGVEKPDQLNTASNLKDLTNINATEVELTIGANWQKTASGGELALVRISKTAPIAEQIAKIYRDEKALFQDGAQATLYGTSDSVTALAYDEKTELLHVGTTSGRSDFSGLRRINNTTTAVTTSISAHNNLIAEQ